MKSKFPGAVPEIPVRDINEAAAYYESNLGFTVDWGGEELGLAGISKGNCRVHEFTAADPDGNLFRVFYDFATPKRAKNA